jgi:hypothetical protein
VPKAGHAASRAAFREEFTNYMFLERAEEASGTISENWRLFPPDFKDKNDPGVSHRGAWCVCVCVCVCEREREREREVG